MLYFCTLCPKYFDTQVQLDKHSRIRHGQCAAANASFKNGARPSLLEQAKEYQERASASDIIVLSNEVLRQISSLAKNNKLRGQQRAQDASNKSDYKSMDYLDKSIDMIEKLNEATGEGHGLANDVEDLGDHYDYDDENRDLDRATRRDKQGDLKPRGRSTLACSCSTENDLPIGAHWLIPLIESTVRRTILHELTAGLKDMQQLSAKSYRPFIGESAFSCKSPSQDVNQQAEVDGRMGSAIVGGDLSTGSGLGCSSMAAVDVVLAGSGGGGGLASNDGKSNSRHEPGAYSERTLHQFSSSKCDCSRDESLAAALACFGGQEQRRPAGADLKQAEGCNWRLEIGGQNVAVVPSGAGTRPSAGASLGRWRRQQQQQMGRAQVSSREQQTIAPDCRHDQAAAHLSPSADEPVSGEPSCLVRASGHEQDLELADGDRKNVPTGLAGGERQQKRVETDDKSMLQTVGKQLACERFQQQEAISRQQNYATATDGGGGPPLGAAKSQEAEGGASGCTANLAPRDGPLQLAAGAGPGSIEDEDNDNLSRGSLPCASSWGAPAGPDFRCLSGGATPGGISGAGGTSPTGVGAQNCSLARLAHHPSDKQYDDRQAPLRQLPATTESSLGSPPAPSAGRASGADESHEETAQVGAGTKIGAADEHNFTNGPQLSDGVEPPSRRPSEPGPSNFEAPLNSAGSSLIDLALSAGSLGSSTGSMASEIATRASGHQIQATENESEMVASDNDNNTTTELGDRVSWLTQRPAGQPGLAGVSTLILRPAAADCGPDKVKNEPSNCDEQLSQWRAAAEDSGRNGDDRAVDALDGVQTGTQMRLQIAIDENREEQCQQQQQQASRSSLSKQQSICCEPAQIPPAPSLKRDKDDAMGAAPPTSATDKQDQPRHQWRRPEQPNPETMVEASDAIDCRQLDSVGWPPPPLANLMNGSIEFNGSLTKTPAASGSGETEIGAKGTTSSADEASSGTHERAAHLAQLAAANSWRPRPIWQDANELGGGTAIASGANDNQEPNRTGLVGGGRRRQEQQEPERALIVDDERELGADGRPLGRLATLGAASQMRQMDKEGQGGADERQTGVGDDAMRLNNNNDEDAPMSNETNKIGAPREAGAREAKAAGCREQPTAVVAHNDDINNNHYHPQLSGKGTQVAQISWRARASIKLVVVMSATLACERIPVDNLNCHPFGLRHL